MYNPTQEMEGELPEVRPHVIVGLWGSVGRLFSLVVGALSLVALIAHTFQVGLVNLLEALLASYNATVGFLFCRVEPYLQPAIDWFGDLLHIDLTLAHHWRHVFLLVAVYFFRDAEASIAIRRPYGATFLSIIGLPIALAISVGAGIIPASHEWCKVFLMGETMVVGITIYDVAKLFWYALFLRKYHADLTGVEPLSTSQFLSKYYVYPGGVFVVGTIASAILPLTPLARAAADPGIVTALCLILLYTAWWLAVGLRRALKKSSPARPWWRLYTQSGPGLLGLAMLTVFFWAMSLLALNYGAALLGIA